MQQDTELRREIIGEVAGLGEVLARLQKDDEGRPVGSERVQPPTLGRPDVLVVRGQTAAAIDTALAVARLFPLDRRPEGARGHLAVEREGIPLLDRRHAQRVGFTGVQLLRSLRHGAMLTLWSGPELSPLARLDT